MADAPSQPEDFLATLTSIWDPSAAVVSPPPPPPVSVPEMAPQPVPAARTDLLGGFVAPTAPPPVPAARVDLLGGLTAPASAPYMPAGAVDLLGGFGEAASGPSTAHGVEYVYHEKQLSALCGVHTLNNLCQGPQFGAGDLAELALSLDAREVELLTSPGGHLDRAAASQHIDQHSGDFSVEVLKAALAQLGCRLVNAEHAELVERLAEAPEAEEGYLMHRSSHWFALRPLAGIWWNLDSRLARPRRLSAAALRELVTRLRVDGGTVHVVQQLPPPAVHNAGHAGREQVLHPVEYLLTSTEPELLRGADADAADDADAALAAALEAEEAAAAAFGGSDPDAALAAALQREEEEAAAAAAVAEAERARRAERSAAVVRLTREPAAGSAVAGAAAGAASGAAPPPAGVARKDGPDDRRRLRPARGLDARGSAARGGADGTGAGRAASSRRTGTGSAAAAADRARDGGGVAARLVAAVRPADRAGGGGLPWRATAARLRRRRRAAAAARP